MMRTEAGPIATRILRQVDKQRRRTVVDLAQLRNARARVKRTLDEAVPPPEAYDKSPGFAAYAYVTNWALGVVEAIQDMSALGRFMDRIARAEEEYMPSEPPMSPLTGSYFWSWALWDLTVGVKRETLGSILLALVGSRGADSIFTAMLRNLVESRLGLHVHEGMAGDRVHLRELVTDERRSCVCPAGHRGKAGELWLARVLPPVGEANEHVVVTTPYVIIDPGVPAWRAFLARTLPELSAPDERAAYARLMKRGLDERYWSEYVFEAYANHRPEVIFLRGLPDVPESRPHSRVNADKW